MKFDNPVSVPVDSILAWGGCDTEDLLDAKFHACDLADSTTGKEMALGGIGSSCGQANLLTIDNLDSLLLHGPAHPHATSSLTPHPGTPHSNGHSFAELKPLPPFDYGPLPPINTDLGTGSDVEAVTGSSSSCSSNLNDGGPRAILDINLNLYKASAPPSSSGGGVYFSSEPVSTTSTLVNGLVSVVSGLQKEVGVAEYLLNPEIDDIAAIIGNAIADSTVNHVAVDPHQIQTGGGMGMVMAGGPGPDLRDPWADIDAWIESACATAYKNEPMLESPGSSITSGSSLGSTAGTTVFGHPNTHRLPPSSGGGGANSGASPNGQLTSSCSVTSTLQSLLTSGLNPGAPSNGGSGPADHAITAIKSEPSLDMPLLQRRLTAGRGPESSNTPSSHYVSCSLAGKDSVPHTTSYSSNTPSGGPPNLNQVTTTIPHISNDTVHSSTFPRRSASKTTKMELDLAEDLLGPSLGVGVVGSGSSSSKKNKNRIGKSKMTTIMTTEGGKEKPVHRCNICNRGFLNKSNIKVHLRTHTGEKPFKCDACAKAFRQKAHLLKHMQIHKRVTRD